MTAEYVDVSVRLVTAMTDANVSVRELASRLAKKTGLSEKSWRRMLKRYRKGEIRPRKNALLLAQELGKPDDYFVTPRQSSETLATWRAQVDSQLAALTGAVSSIEMHLSLGAEESDS